MPKSEERSGSSEQSEGSMDGGSADRSDVGSKKEETGDEVNSQDDVKSEDATNASGTGMALRERRKRTRPNHRFSPEQSPAPPPVAERRSSARAEKTSTVSMNSEVSHWLQCDSCQKWRIVSHKLFEDLKKLSRFECRNLQGVSCKDRDDWGAIGSEDTSVKDDASVDYRRRVRKQIKRVNIFSGKYIPGFAGEFSDFGDD